MSITSIEINKLKNLIEKYGSDDDIRNFNFISTSFLSVKLLSKRLTRNYKRNIIKKYLK